MKNLKQYLIRAVYECIVDNGHKPFVCVYSHGYGFKLPLSLPPPPIDDPAFFVFDLSPDSVIDLTIDPKAEAITCYMSFAGTVVLLTIPFSAVSSISAKETGFGYSFPMEAPVQPKAEEQAVKKRPHLRLVTE